MTRKKCSNCNQKIKKSHNFCSNCGKIIKQDSFEEWGMIGKNDSMNKNDEMAMMLQGMGGGMIGKMLNQTMKMLEKEISKETTQNKNPTQIVKGLP